MMRIRIGFVAILALFTLWVTPVLGKAPKTVILMIGDGMGPEQVKAARMYLGEKLSFETFPHQGYVTTRSASHKVTDSAAAATSMASGIKVANGVIGLRLPGDGAAMPTILGQFKAQGKSTGMVTNDAIVGATPGPFAAHVKKRGLTRLIGKQYLTVSRPNVLFGGGDRKAWPLKLVRKHKYVVVETAKDMDRAAAQAARLVARGKPVFLNAAFGSGQMPYQYIDERDGHGKYKTYPRLGQMTRAALKVLEKDRNGFFLMVECGLIDKSGHSIKIKEEKPDTRIGCNVYETLNFHESAKAVAEWAKGRNDVLVVVTADHETGGMKVLKDNGKGKLPTVKWSHKNHTGVNIGVYAMGVGAETFRGTIDNTDIYKKIAALTGLKPVVETTATDGGKVAGN